MRVMGADISAACRQILERTVASQTQFCRNRPGLIRTPMARFAVYAAQHMKVAQRHFRLQCKRRIVPVTRHARLEIHLRSRHMAGRQYVFSCVTGPAISRPGRRRLARPGAKQRSQDAGNSNDRPSMQVTFVRHRYASLIFRRGSQTGRAGTQRTRPHSRSSQVHAGSAAAFRPAMRPNTRQSPTAQEPRRTAP